MKKNLKDYVVHFDNFIPKNICDDTIKYMEDINFQQHDFYNPTKKEYATRSGNKELDISWDNIPTTDSIHKHFWNAVKKYQEKFKFPWFDGWQGFTNVRFNKYKETRKMALHADHIHTMFDGERKGIPILSVLSTLNEDYKGGDFVLFDKHKIKFKTGDILIFPSNFMYPHKVEPVTKGIRYSMISWVW